MERNQTYGAVTSGIRPLDPSSDLGAVADLIELCFAHTMDMDGIDYLRQMRQAATNAAFRRWAPRAAERVSLPLSGYVWTEQGRIIGNLSLIPLHKQGQRIYLIANVAVHPDFRRRGIARRLTEEALRHVQRRGAPTTWLQVRDDNPVAIHLYQTLGFQERSRRTTWISQPGSLPEKSPDGVRVYTRRREDWHQQRIWLAEIYPPEVIWNLPLRINRLKPSLLNELNFFFSGEAIKHWSARLQGKLIGVLSLEATHGYADNLWLAVDPLFEDTAIAGLLRHARRETYHRKQLTANYPAGRAEQAFRWAGFDAVQTLIWMEHPFT